MCGICDRYGLFYVQSLTHVKCVFPIIPFAQLNYIFRMGERNMKRKACMALMVLLMVTSVFAGAYSGSGRVGDKASAELNFSLKPEDVNSYQFGFTKEQVWRPSEGAPESLDTIDLKLNEDKESASSKGVAKIYYIISADKMPTLTLKAGKGLHRDGTEKLISYDLVADGITGKVTVSSGQVGKTLPLGQLDGKGYTAGSFSLDINTTTKITPDMASSEHDWEDAIELEISSL